MSNVRINNIVPFKLKIALIIVNQIWKVALNFNYSFFQDSFANSKTSECTKCNNGC